MSDWRHECGYKEPDECAFCEHCEKHKNVLGGALIGNQGSCVRTEAQDGNGTGSRLQYLREHTVSLRGTCRHFKRRKN